MYHKRDIFDDMEVSLIELIFIFTIDLVFAEGDFCSNTTLHNEEEISWESAYQKCKSKKGMLLVPNKDILEKLAQCPGSYDEVWVGKFKFMSPWLEIYGCYSWNQQLAESHYRHLITNQQISYNHPAFCNLACPDQTYFGVQNNTCFCLGNLVNSSYLVKKRADPCDIRCRLQPELYCGGNNSLSVYKYGQFVVQNESDDKKCATYSCIDQPNGHSLALFAEECSSPNRMFCENGGDVPGFDPWSIKLNHCVTVLHQYAFLSDKNTTFCSPDARNAWSGLFRNDLNGTRNLAFKDTLPRHTVGCYKLKNDNGKYILEIADCTQQHYYICKTGQEGVLSTLVTTKSTTPSTNMGTSTNISATWLTITSTIFSSTTNTKSEETTTCANDSKLMNGSSQPSTNQQRKDNTGIIVGVVVAVIVILFLVIGILYLKKRKFSKDSSASTHPNNTRDVDNKLANIYELAKLPNLDESEPLKNSDFLKLPVGNANQVANEYSLAQFPESDNRQIGTGYDFAKVPGSSRHQTLSDYEFANPAESDYSSADFVYSETKEGEYDALHDQNRRIHNDENNVYSHTNVGDVAENEYDVTHTQSKQEQDTSNYDQANFKCSDYNYSFIAHNDQGSDTYDHSKNQKIHSKQS